MDNAYFNQFENYKGLNRVRENFSDERANFLGFEKLKFRNPKFLQNELNVKTIWVREAINLNSSFGDMGVLIVLETYFKNIAKLETNYYCIGGTYCFTSRYNDLTLEPLKKLRLIEFSNEFKEDLALIFKSANIKYHTELFELRDLTQLGLLIKELDELAED